MAELLALFEAWRADVDSVPFAHEHQWNQVGDLTEVTP